MPATRSPGVIDEVSVHSIALTAAQVGQLWATGSNGPSGGTNHAPTAVASGNPTSGTAPLTVQFTGSASSDQDPGDTLTYAWDFSSDGTIDSTLANPSFTYPAAGSFTATLRVTDNHGLPSSPATVPITVNAAANNPPVPVISTPVVGTTFIVGQVDPVLGLRNGPRGRDARRRPS